MKIFCLFATMIFASGCVSLVEMIPGFTHTAVLIIGESENNVVMQAEHILTSLKQEAYAGKGTVDEVRIRRYAFTNVYDLVLYFHNGVFFQANLTEPRSETYPEIRLDFKEIHKGSPGPIGYIIASNGRTMSIKTFWRKGEEPKE